MGSARASSRHVLTKILKTIHPNQKTVKMPKPLRKKSWTTNMSRLVSLVQLSVIHLAATLMC